MIMQRLNCPGFCGDRTTRGNSVGKSAPTNSTRRTDAKPFSNLTTRHTTRYSRNNTFAKIQNNVRDDIHNCPHSGCHLESDHNNFGNSQRFMQRRKCSKSPFENGHGWTILRSMMLPRATWIIASETSILCS